MRTRARRGWSLVKKIQGATNYVQERLTESQRMRHQISDLEKQKEALGLELDQLHELLDHGRRQVSLLRWQTGSGDVGAAPRGHGSGSVKRSLRLLP